MILACYHIRTVDATQDRYNLTYVSSRGPVALMRAGIPLDDACDAAVAYAEQNRLPVWLDGALYYSPEVSAA